MFCGIPNFKTNPFGCGSKFNRRGYAGVGPCSPLTRVPFWYRFFEPQPFGSGKCVTSEPFYLN